MLRIACNIFWVVLLCWCVSCRNPHSAETDSSFSFSVIDVGQGLAQLGIYRHEALAWDVGDSAAATNWQSAYSDLASPTLRAIVISHTHRDHYGNLAFLPTDLEFTGLLITSPYEDTALLRERSGSLKNKIYFRTIGRGDTLGMLDGVYIECLWPPQNLAMAIPIADSLKNRYSLVFLVRFQNTSLIISSDIDSIAEKALARDFGYALTTDFLVVPHHGSGGSVEPLFFGFIQPRRAIISCGLHNPYGHPAASMLDLLFEQGTTILQTSTQGSITTTSNGFYWSW